jgi:hypothetical protein
MRDEMDEREVQAQLFSLLGGGRTDRPDCLLDLAELDITADMEPDCDQEEESSSLMVFLEEVSPIHRSVLYQLSSQLYITLLACAVLWIQIRKDPKLFAGSGTVTRGYGSGFGSETGFKSY